MNDKLPNSDPLFHIGHRERLRRKFKEEKLTDDEKLELFLSYIIPRRDVRPLARALMAKYLTLYQVITAPIDDLRKFPGIGENTAIALKLLQDLLVTGYKGQMMEEKVFHNEKIFHNYCQMMLNGKMKEEFHVIYMDQNMRLLDNELHSRGTIDWTGIYSREIVRRALDLNAKYVALAHNHPMSGESFSTPDIKLTTELQSVLEKLGIELYDHIVVSNGIAYSARNLHLLK